MLIPPRAPAALATCVVMLELAAHAGAQAKSPSAAPPGPQPSPAAVVTVDLAQPPGEVRRFEVPSGTIEVRVRNAAPGAFYKFNLRRPDGIGTGRNLSNLARGGTAPPAGPPECVDWYAAKQAFLRVTRESETAAATEALLHAANGSRCAWAKSESAALAERPMASLTFGLAPGSSSRVAVERLDEANQVVARWEAVLQDAGRPAGWSYRNEGEWLVAATAGDLARLVRYARAGRLPRTTVTIESRPPTGRWPAYRLKFDGEPAWSGLEVELQIRDHVWASATYRGLATELLTREGLKASPSAAAGSLLGDLTDLRLRVLLAANQRLSAELSDHPLDPGTHERAALLLGALGLREGSGPFADLRPTLSGMAAHLALAAALRGRAPSSPEGQVAAVMVDVLSGRVVPAAAEIARLEAGPQVPGLRPWLRALALRATRDWKRLDKPEAATLLERICYARALASAVGEAAALDFIDRIEGGLPVDWNRIFLNSLRSSVEVANTARRTAVASELAEAGTVAGLPAVDPPATVVAGLARVDQQDQGRLGPGPRPQIAGPAFLARGAARHLAEAARAEVEGLEQTLGRVEDARERADELSRLLEPLPQADFLRVAWFAGRKGAAREAYAAACAKAADLLAHRPELAPEGGWQRVEGQCLRERDAGRVVSLEQWLDPVVPAGTAYAVAVRLHLEARFLEKLGRDDLAGIYALAPREKGVLYPYVGRGLGRDLTRQDVEAAWGSSWDQEIEPLAWLVKVASERSDSAELLDLRGRQCRLDAVWCPRYGAELVAAGRIEEAVVAYERAVVSARDRVAVANDADWLADYYLDHGRIDDALKLASEAGAAFSLDGLFTQARVLERLGRLEEAEAVYRAQAERYETHGLDHFYTRRAYRGDATYASLAAPAVKRIFGPEGLVRAELASLTPATPGSPAAGLLLDQQWMTPRYVKAGLRRGDLLRAVNGIRVGDASQWYCARSFTDEPELHLIVQRAGNLIEIAGPFERAKFGPVAAFQRR